jgi:hypothetical protein
MLFHFSSKKYFEAIPPPIFIKFFLYKEKYLDYRRITSHQIGLGENDNKTCIEILPV